MESLLRCTNQGCLCIVSCNLPNALGTDRCCPRDSDEDVRRSPLLFHLELQGLPGDPPHRCELQKRALRLPHLCASPSLPVSPRCQWDRSRNRILPAPQTLPSCPLPGPGTPLSKVDTIHFYHHAYTLTSLHTWNPTCFRVWLVFPPSKSCVRVSLIVACSCRLFIVIAIILCEISQFTYPLYG